MYSHSDKCQLRRSVRNIGKLTHILNVTESADIKELCRALLSNDADIILDIIEYEEKEREHRNL